MELNQPSTDRPVTPLTPAQRRFLDHVKDHAEATAKESGSNDTTGDRLATAGYVTRSYTSWADTPLTFYTITAAGRTALARP